MSSKIAVILAAGDGRRMKSNKPKVLCEVLFKPMLGWVISACEQAGVTDICVVKGFGADEVDKYLGGKYQSVLQQERLGTGHAVLTASDFLKSCPDLDVLVLCGDAPLIDAQTIEQAYAQHSAQKNAVTVISAEVENPCNYGRIMRRDGAVCAIIEHKDATPDQLVIREINSGAYWFNSKALLEALDSLKNANSQGEYYLTDTLGILLEKGYKAGAYVSENANIALGANSRKDLLLLNKIARDIVLDRLMNDGVEVVSDDGVIISPDAKIGSDTQILPGTIIRGKTVIGQNCKIGPNSLIDKSFIGDDTVINASQILSSTVKSHVKIGPFSQLRPDCVLGDYVKIGDFVELKNSTLGEKTSVSHLTYIGDSDVGSNVNFGCGVVTVNYSGDVKGRTTIGNDSFIGCNTNLVAPVNIGNRAYTAAGSTITKDVPDGSLAIARNRQENKEGYAESRLGRHLKGSVKK